MSLRDKLETALVTLPIHVIGELILVAIDATYYVENTWRKWND